MKTIGRNLLGIIIFYSLFWIAARSAAFLEHEAENTLEMLAAVLGVWITFRLHAVVAAYFAGMVTVGSAVEFLYHVIFGYTTVQTGPVHTAVFTASLVGLIVGAISFPRLMANRGGGSQQVSA